MINLIPLKFEKYIIVVLFLLIHCSSLLAQDNADEEGKKPVESPFESTVLIDNQTSTNVYPKSLELMIHHRLGALDNGLTDLYGIYGASNIRLGINYGITKKLSVGFGTERDNMMQEFQWKYNILTQTQSGSIPIALTYCGNVVIDARDEDLFGMNYKFVNRLSYFNQLIVGRKFSERLSLQLAAAYTHFNAVKIENGIVHDNIGISFGGRFKVYNYNSIIFEFDYPIPIEGGNTYVDSLTIDPKPNIALGFEFNTGTHALQIFLANYREIVAQKNYAYNENDFTEDFVENFLIGFNITVRF